MSLDDVKCPYCGSDNEICHDDGYSYEECEPHQTVCSECDKNFVFYTEISFSYDAYKADCLNGGEHKYKETNTFPRCYRKLRCSVCGEEKEIEGIDKERKAYLAGLGRR